MADVGYRIKVEGEQEFNAALKEINNNIKLNQAQLKLLTEEYNTNGGSAETLAEKSKVLQEAHDRQADKLQKMRDYYAKCADVMDETDPKMVKLATEITKQETELVKLNQQIDQNGKAMKAASSGVQGYDDDIAALDRSLEQSRAEMAQVDQALKDVDRATKDAGASVETMGQKADLTSKRSETLSRAVETQKTKCTELSKALQTAESTWGKNSEQADKYRLQLTKAETELDKMQGELTETQAAAKQADDAMNGIGGKLPEATSNAQLLGGAFGDVGNKVGGILDQVGVQLPAGITDVIGQFGMMAGAAGAVVTAVVGIVDEINKARDEAAGYVDDLATTASIADLPTEIVQEWQYMADMVDVSVDTVIGAMRKLKENMRDAVSAGNSFIQVGESIVPIYDEQTGELRDLNEVFLDSLDGLKGISDYLDRDAASMELFGKKSSELNPLLDQSRQNIEALRDAAHESGYVTDDVSQRILGNWQNVKDQLAKNEEAYKRNQAAYQTALRSMDQLSAGELRQVENNLFAAEKAYSDSLRATKGFFNTIHATMLDIGAGAKKLFLGIKDFFTGGSSYAAGTSSATAGLSLTGEAGPEFYRVSGGSVSRRSGALASAIEAATGGRYSVLGEGGPELVNLHGGERIWPNGQIPADLRRLGINAAIRGYAEGVMSAPAGMALAGERGPEIVRTSAAAGSGGEAGTVNYYYDVRIEADRIKELSDIVRIAESEKRLRRMGYSGR